MLQNNKPFLRRKVKGAIVSTTEAGITNYQQHIGVISLNKVALRVNEEPVLALCASLFRA